MASERRTPARKTADDKRHEHATKTPARRRARAGDTARLEHYRARRDFAVTSEPAPRTVASSGPLSFVVQKHAARQLHYDFRLELDGVLVSWAIPKGPSLDPDDRRLAVHVEDHPVAYAGFEGTIPEGQYGAGTVIVWDQGTWEPEGDARAGIEQGKLAFRLHGRKLAGLWELVKMPKRGERQESWLLFKKHDEWARAHKEYDIVEELPDSVIAHPLPSQESSMPRADHRRRKAKPVGGDLELPPGARKKARLPETLSPQLATLAKFPPTQGEWLHELKFDGYRLLTRFDGGRATLFTRGGLDWTGKLRTLARDLELLGLDDAWLDGEAVVLDDQGRPHFNLLQNALDAARSEPVMYYVFDLPFAFGHDLRDVPLAQRRAFLERIVQARPAEHVRYSAEFGGDAREVLRSACDLQLEGIIAKRRDSRYTSARSTDWLKLKCHARQEFVIGGYSDRSDNPQAVGALMLGYYDDDGGLRYAGRVGTGWSAADAVSLHDRLSRLDAKESPFAAVKRPALPARLGAADHWVRPRLVAEIAFAQWTPDGSVRHASYQGLRDDKDPRAVKRETPQSPPGPRGRRASAKRPSDKASQRR
jgi:bifunctional non-homologous end joining protein LigD